MRGSSLVATRSRVGRTMTRFLDGPPFREAPRSCSCTQARLAGTLLRNHGLLVMGVLVAGLVRSWMEVLSCDLQGIKPPSIVWLSSSSCLISLPSSLQLYLPWLHRLSPTLCRVQISPLRPNQPARPNIYQRPVLHPNPPPYQRYPTHQYSLVLALPP
ncbi:hypothetical protein PSTG_18487 [Puccinia striiformis f. sp. tritici PST-78]|uniref:Uncharacterized protein n=1 Tax=Puccinia striiformis f. sp. tritici PST-78 TaxID=1165861 RepID=A0A0L0UM89_9BASI|nr:hypothetical protein PSTG_18487 [Puccinia striiformis f. sp. tritici PST-78]